jgi:hypothetical protein
MAKRNIFEGIDTTWNRLPGGSRVHPLVIRALAEFNPENPAATVPLLLQIRKAIMALGKSVWKERKLQETEQLIQDCLGLFIEVRAAHYQAAPGEKIKASIEIVNRTATRLKIEGARPSGVRWDSAFSQVVETNKPVVITLSATVDDDAEFSDPYWLKSPHTTGLYTVKDETRIGMPQNNPAVTFSFVVRIGDDALTLHRPMIHTWVDPVKGELWRPFEIVPPVSVGLSESVLVFGTSEPKQVTLRIRSASDQHLSGNLQLKLPSAWRAEPASLAFELKGRGAEESRTITVFPSSAEYNGTIKAVATINGKEFDQTLQTISYDHFPIQTLLPPAEARAVRIDLKKEGNSIGYIRGAGDEIPSALRNMGYDVWEMNNDEITPDNLKRMDAVVLGIRALNTNDRVKYFMGALLDYVSEGGTLIVQYNTSGRLETDNFSPYPLTLGRERVTDETSEVRILKPGHAVLNTPNKIAAADFKGWVQERGLYFPTQWDERFEAVVSMNDNGEQP